ncbi:hypothetical protein [Azospirillum griseum]|nr:hypothetical protein [Azospirillum griseum]
MLLTAAAANLRRADAVSLDIGDDRVENGTATLIVRRGGADEH